MCVIMQDLTVVAALRQKGVPTDTVLDSDVHGRGGLKSCLLQNPRRLSDTSSAAMVRLCDLWCSHSYCSLQLHCSVEPMGPVPLLLLVLHDRGAAL